MYLPALVSLVVNLLYNRWYLPVTYLCCSCALNPSDLRPTTLVSLRAHAHHIRSKGMYITVIKLINYNLHYTLKPNLRTKYSLHIQNCNTDLVDFTGMLMRKCTLNKNQASHQVSTHIFTMGLK